jgi:hemolysin III
MPKQWEMSFGEEVANSVTHGVMALIILLALPATAVSAHTIGGALPAFAKSVFMISMFLMFASSALYHSMALNTRHKQVFQLLDHIFIYVAIAGSYTPIALIVVGGRLGTIIVAIQWMLVILGVLYKSLIARPVTKMGLMIYLVMGWTAVVLLPELIKKGNTTLIVLILAGGLFYSIGVVFYATKWFRYHHMVWHIFINLAALTHFIAIAFFI